MPAIADASGIALDTVYATVGKKPALFRLLVEMAISGQDEAVPDPRRQIMARVDHLGAVAPLVTSTWSSR